jgi:hypothetical protein
LNSLDFTRLSDEVYLSCISCKVPLKKVLHSLTTQKGRQSAVEDKDIFYDFTDSEEESEQGEEKI